MILVNGLAAFPLLLLVAILDCVAVLIAARLIGGSFNAIRSTTGFRNLQGLVDPLFDVAATWVNRLCGRPVPAALVWSGLLLGLWLLHAICVALIGGFPRVVR